MLYEAHLHEMAEVV